jgi:histidinol-phosphate/aromatic aminotransferase/cobyric acid decarboxylase-like protein
MMNRRQLMKAGAMAAVALSLDKSTGGALAYGKASLTKGAAPFVRLWGNENPHGPSPLARRAMMDALVSGNRYAMPGVMITGNRSPLSGDWARVTLGTPEEMRVFISAYKESMKL